MSDLIDRQAAIESIRECAEAAHDNHEWDMEQGYLNAIECIDEEPSAQPAQAIKDCRSCKYGKYNDHYDTCFCYNKEDCSDWDKWESAQPERQKAEWLEIEVIPEAYDIAGVKTWASKMMCNKCYFSTYAIEGHFGQYIFCPNCGARMDGKENEQD